MGKVPAKSSSSSSSIARVASIHEALVVGAEKDGREEGRKEEEEGDELVR